MRERRAGRRRRRVTGQPGQVVNGNPDLVTGEDGLARPVWAATDPLLREYYDTEWGMPVRDEAGLYERIVLEGFQAGLSWRTVLA